MKDQGELFEMSKTKYKLKTNEYELGKLKTKYKVKHDLYDKKLADIRLTISRFTERVSKLETTYYNLYNEKYAELQKIEDELQRLCHHDEYPKRRVENQNFCSNCDKDLGYSDR